MRGLGGMLLGDAVTQGEVSEERSRKQLKRAEDGSRAHLELLLLPFNNRAHTPLSLTGLLAPLGGEYRAIRDFDLVSWRYIGHPPQRFGPRVLRKLKVARGFMVYEGLR